ncbi:MULTISPECIES: hypothetical protein [Burkholderia]|nr:MULTISPECIES: hypothetical protein [Burkholderia]AOI76058.1 hypothetical protein WS54_07090 [Burkholderia sp. NRF60-BP8]KVA07136.1 hypothetical protein WS54_23515 [Burkholderia sp. NRF60-BP8]MEB2554047.1 hypothetical protein [Burkholderia cenocepacia]
MLLPIADYAPDLPPNNNAGTSANIVNLFPKTRESWGPVGTLSNYSSNGLTSQCLGALVAIDMGANNYVFAGDAGKLYELSPGSTVFANVSKTGGYSLASGEKWFFTQYGQRIIAAAQGQNLQSFTLNSSSAFADLAAAAPQARYITTIKDWVMVGNTFDGTNGAQPQRVQWCAIDDPTNWPVSGSTTEAQLLAGSQIIPGDQGWIMGLVGNLGTADGAIFFERAVWRVVFQGSPTVFGFYPAEGSRGTPAPKSIIQLGALVYYLGEDGFYAFDGSTSRPIGVDRVDKTFWNTVNQSYLYNVVGAIDPINRLVMWLYPSTSAPSGIPDSLLVYNWALDKWGFAQINAEYIFRAITQGYSLDSLDSTGYTLDSLPFSLDSRVWVGGQVLMGAFTTSHALAYFTGSPASASADTVEVEPFGSAGKRALVTSVRPMVDGGSPTISIGTRQRLVDAPAFTATSAINANGECPMRADGRYLRGRILTTGTFSHLQGIEIPESEVHMTGRR